MYVFPRAGNPTMDITVGLLMTLGHDAGRTGVINDGILFAPALPDPGTVLLKDVLDVGQLLKLSDIPGKILLQLSSS